MKLTALLISLIWLTSCVTLKPSDYVYQIIDNKICYFDKIEDIQKKKAMCKEMKDLNGWMVISPEKLKEVLTKGVEDLLIIKLQDKPK